MGEQRSGPRRFCHAKTAVLFLLIIAVIGLVIYISVSTKPSCDEDGSNDDVTFAECDDISIIGAGIAGTYTAWRLRNAGVKIGIYEYLSRVGGRLHTQYFPDVPDIPIELGGNRFFPNAQPLMNKTAFELGLPVVDIKGSWDEKDALYYLRGKHFLYDELKGDRIPYNLNQKDKLDPDNLRWKIFVENSNISSFPYKYEDLFTLATPDGIPFYEQSFQEMFVKYSSMEAWRYWRGVSGWRSCDKDVSALMFFPTEKPDPNNKESSSYSSAKTIGTGMESYPRLLLEGFRQKSSRHKFYPRFKLEAITKRQKEGVYSLKFITSGDQQNTADFKSGKVMKKCSKNVVLAIPSTPLLQIQWDVFNSKKVRSYLNSVVQGHATKLYLVYERAWWRTFPKSRALALSDLPTMRTIDFGVSRESGKAVLLVAYVDSEDVKYWKHLQNTGSRFGSFTGSNAASSRVVEQAQIFLSQIFNTSISSIPEPVDGIMTFWDSFPFGSGWDMWKPGYFMPDVVKFLVQPSKADNVFIASGAYSLHYGSDWAENALQAAENVLEILQARFKLSRG